MLHPPSLPRWDQFTTVADCQGPWADYRRLLTAADYYRGFPCDAAHRLCLAVGLCVCTPASRVCIKGFPYAVWLSLPVVFITHLCYGSRARRMDAGDGVKRIGRADQPQQLAGRAGSLRALLLSRRSFSTFSCRYSLAGPQPQRHNEWTRTSKYAWRVVLSMHISNGLSRQPVARPVVRGAVGKIAFSGRPLQQKLT